MKISLRYVPESPIDSKWLASVIGLAPSKQQAINWTNNDPAHWRIYASSGPKVLIIICAFPE